MWKQLIFLAAVIAVCVSEITAPGIDREVSDGVKSMGYKIVYGDEDMTVINQVVSDMEKDVLKSKVNLNEGIPQLPAQDVKCLMSVDRYCSKQMVAMKRVLISALKEDCVKCSQEERENAGRVIAAMLAHDPVAWKMFLTRLALLSKPPKATPEVKNVKFATLGEPEDVVKSTYRYIRPGVNVRIKRFIAEIVPEF